jgi:hypothetical protein
MCRLQKCCCCIDLPTGAKILGILGIIGNLLYIIICLVAIFAYQMIVDYSKNQNDDFQDQLNEQQKEMLRFLLAHEIGKFCEL